MTGRERVQAVLAGQVPDSVPRALYDVAIDTYNDTTIELFEEKTGKHPRDCFRHDIQGVRLARREMEKGFWGHVWQATGDPDELRRRLRPWVKNPDDPARLRAQVRDAHGRGRAALAVGLVSDFETPFGRRGREQFFLDLGMEEPWLPVFIDALAEAAAQDARAAAGAGADLFGIGDDLGSQRGLLIHPDQWRRLFKPALARIVAATKEPDTGTRFFLHTDGLVTEVVPDFIEVGVDVLNPIQPEVMDPAQVKRDYGRALKFLGAISVQYNLPFGAPEDVAREVRERMDTIGAGGGYIMTPSHMLNADIPWENIKAFFEAADRYGTYERTA